MKSMKWMFLLFLLGFSSTCTISFKRGFERVTGVEVPDQWTVPNSVGFVREIRPVTSGFVEILAPAIPAEKRERVIRDIAEVRSLIYTAEKTLVTAWNAYALSRDGEELAAAFIQYQKALKQFLDLVSLAAPSFDLGEYEPIITTLGQLAGLALAGVDMKWDMVSIPPDGYPEDFDFVRDWAEPLIARLSEGA